MKKASCDIIKKDGKYSIIINDKKILKLLLPVIYSDIDNYYFYVCDYEGTNTYFGKQYWADRNINFIEYSNENAFGFKGSEINFVTHDKIDKINIFVNNDERVSSKNYSEAFEIYTDGTLIITSINYSVIAKIIMFLIEHNLFFLFSKNYSREKFLAFLNSFLDTNFTGKIIIYTKTLRLRNGINFKIGITDLNKQTSLYKIFFLNNNWYSDKIIEKSDITEYELKEKINYFYVFLFFSFIIVGILLIATQLRFNIAIFVFAFLSLISCFKYFFKKIKILVGFKIAVKSR